MMLDAWRTEKKQLDLITVCFAAELSLLRLQARSIRMFMDGEILGRIILVINELSPRRVKRAIKHDVLPEYGDFADRVVLLTAKELAGVRLNKCGWGTQQVFKILASAYAASPLLMILDCKNHFIRPVGPDQIWSGDGRIKTRPYRVIPRFAGYFQAAKTYFGVAPDVGTGVALPTTTPFLVPTKLVADLIAEMEEREGKRFFEVFMQPKKRFTEFYLIYAYLLSKVGSLEVLYDVVPNHAVSIMRSQQVDVDAVNAKIVQLEQEDVYCFGVHRDVLVEGDPRILGAVTQVWRRFGLVHSTEEAASFHKVTIKTAKKKVWFFR